MLIWLYLVHGSLDTDEDMSKMPVSKELLSIV